MDFKQIFRKMNLDSDVRSLKPWEYRKLTNGIPIQPASSSYGNPVLDTITNVLGNSLVSFSLPGGTNKVVGSLEDRAGNRLFYFVANSTPSNNSIYQYASGAITLVLRSSLLEFASTDFIDSDISANILLFTNNRTDIYQINVAKAIAGGTYTPAIQELTLIKKPPELPVTIALTYDKTYANNFLSGHYFQFYHRYIYSEGEASVFGAASILDDAWEQPPTNVEMASFVNEALTGATADGLGSTGDRILCGGQTDPKENGIYVVNTGGAWSRATDADTGAEIFALYVYVKTGVLYATKVFKNSNTSAITIGVTNIFFIEVKGPNKATISRPSSPPATVAEIEYAVRIDGSDELFVYRIEKPAFSSSHTFYNDTYLYTVPDSEALKFNDSIPLKAKTLRIFKNRPFLANYTEGFTQASTASVTLTASQVTPGDVRAVQHAKDGCTYLVGLMFSDVYGRHSGIQCTSSISIPYRKRYDDLFVYRINVDLSAISAQIPSWATHYQVMATRPTDKSFFIQYQAADFFYYKKDADGVLTFTKTSGTDTSGSVVLISNWIAEGIGYTFNQGDRMRFLSKFNSSQDYEYQEYDVAITGQDGGFLFIDTINGAPLLTGSSEQVTIEVYTPKEAIVEPFFEQGKKYVVSAGPSFSTTSITLEGDVSSVLRNFYTNGTSPAYSQSAPYDNQYIRISAVYFFEAMNSWNENFQKWVNGAGRSTISDGNGSRQFIKSNYLKFGQNIILDSKILGINTFNALDEYKLPIENGPITQLSESETVLVAIHETEHTSLYIGQGFVNTSNGNEFLAKTDAVVGDDRKNMGGFGTTVQSAVVERNGRVYSLDLRKGAIIRKSQDGLTIISDYGISSLVSTLCTTHIALGANSRIIAGWDPQYNCYCISFIDITTTPAGVTLYFHEKSNGWVCQTDIKPEFFGILGQKQIAFLSGALWLQSTETNYNNWFGVQYNRSLDWEIGNDSIEKVWEAIEVDVERIYTTQQVLVIDSASWTQPATISSDQNFDSKVGNVFVKTGMSGPPSLQEYSAEQAAVIASGVTPNQLSVTITRTVVGGHTVTVQFIFVGPSGAVSSVSLNITTSGTTTYQLNFPALSGASTVMAIVAFELGGSGSDVSINFAAGQEIAPVGLNEDIVKLYHKNGGTLQTRINYYDLVHRGSAWRSTFFSDLNDPNFGSTTLSKYGSSNLIRGQSAFLNIVNNYYSTPNPLKSITVFYRPSPNTSP